jgi:hypothetical protein
MMIGIATKIATGRGIKEAYSREFDPVKNQKPKKNVIDIKLTQIQIGHITQICFLLHLHIFAICVSLDSYYQKRC